jgi:hypothetical protein
MIKRLQMVPRDGEQFADSSQRWSAMSVDPWNGQSKSAKEEMDG